MRDLSLSMDPSFANPVQFLSRSEPTPNPSSQTHSHSEYNYHQQEPVSSPRPPLAFRQRPSLPSSTGDSPTLADLLAYPAVQELYNDLMQANRRVAQALESQDNLQKEILRLSHDLWDVKGKYLDGTSM